MAEMVMAASNWATESWAAAGGVVSCYELRRCGRRAAASGRRRSRRDLQALLGGVGEGLDEDVGLRGGVAVVGPGEGVVAGVVELLHLRLVVGVVRPLEDVELRRGDDVLDVGGEVGRSAVFAAAGNEAEKAKCKRGNEQCPARRYGRLHDGPSW